MSPLHLPHPTDLPRPHPVDIWPSPPLTSKTLHLQALSHQVALFSACIAPKGLGPISPSCGHNHPSHLYSLSPSQLPHGHICCFRSQTSCLYLSQIKLRELQKLPPQLLLPHPFTTKLPSYRTPSPRLHLFATPLICSTIPSDSLLSPALYLSTVSQEWNALTHMHTPNLALICFTRSL